MKKRVWHVASGVGMHVVELNYSRWTGGGTLTVDGQKRAHRDPHADHRFRLGERDVVLQPALDGFSYHYDLLVDGRSVDTGMPSPLARRLRWRNWMAGVELFIAMAVVVAATASWLALVELRYERSGQIANGTVVSLRQTERSEGGTRRHVGYRFTAADGSVMEGESEVAAVMYRQLGVGAPVSVQYVADDPTWNRLHGQSDWSLSQWLSAAAAIAGAAALFFLAVRGRRERSERRLAAEGLSANAVITAIDKVQVPQGHYAIRYTYRDQVGRDRHGRSWPLRDVDVIGFSVGDRCRVRYSDENAAVSLFVERLPRHA